MLLLDQNHDVLHHFDSLSVVYQVRMQAPYEELSLAIITKLDKLLDHSDALHTRVEHPEQELVSIELFGSLLIATETESELEDVICHQVYNYALIIPDSVLQSDDSEVLIVSFKQVLQLVDLVTELFLIKFANTVMESTTTASLAHG